jgi:hypothetical protein
MKPNINLGDKSKFVAWGTNGMKNCLDHCKLILKKHGLTEFGSPSKMYILLMEDGNKLSYTCNNPKEMYEDAINCIDKHLEAGRPIIVGVNHTFGNKYNDGTTDHFVVIYGREYDGKHYNYLYYEVGKSNVAAGYNDKENRFVYDTTNPDKPQFYDEKSSRSDQARFDVIQIRSNI